MDKLTKEEVDHIAHLARIGMSDSERETFQVELKKLLDEVKKIVDIKGYDDEFSKACLNFEATGNLPANIISRLKTEYNISIIK